MKICLTFFLQAANIYLYLGKTENSNVTTVTDVIVVGYLQPL
jgi:hypothetical protein